MNTDDLIRALAADMTRPRRVFPDMLWTTFVPIVVLGSAYLWVSGIRPDLLAAVFAPVTAWKWVLPAMVAAGGTVIAARLTRPAAIAGRWPVLLWSAVMIGLVLIVMEMRALPRTDWIGAVRGDTLFICLVSILGIGLPGLIATLSVLKRGATTRPGLTGLAAGLGCGGCATLLYALHCDEDAPLFFVTWYGGAICLLGLAGAILGPRMLRW